MANTRRWCLFIPVASLVCMVIWYSIPFTIESTNRNPVDLKSIKTGIIYKSKQVSVPTVSYQNMTLTVGKVNRINEKYLIFLCDEKRDCGGWGDRQRGIVSLFLLSLVWKRTFKIVLTTPCDIKPYYKPTKEYNWIFTEDELKALKSKRTETFDTMGVDTPLLNMNMSSSEIADVLYVKTNCYNFLLIAQKYNKFLPSYLRNQGRAGVFRESWRRLMTPTDKLLSQVEKIESKGVINLDAKKSGKELVCVHLRTGLSELIPNSYAGFPLEAIPKMWNFIDTHYHNKSRIFIATDNLDARKIAISKYGTRYIGSYAPTLHPDDMRSNLTAACRSQESAYVDQIVLSKCDVLFYYRRSGFSIHASYLKTKWTDIYSIMKIDNSTYSMEKSNHN